MNRPQSLPGGAGAERSRRLFFAFWPDEQLRGELELRIRPILARVAGRPQRPEQWHVTLEFLGAVPDSRTAAVREAASEVHAEAFELTLDRVEHWRRSGVLCLAASATPPALDGLVAALRAALAQRGFTPEQRPFRPHLTLARRVSQVPELPPPEPLAWRVAEFALVESVTEPSGSRYAPLEAWSLHG